MKNIAIVTGGPSAERGIALNSAALVEKYIDNEKYRTYTVLLEEDGWHHRDSDATIDLNDFSLEVDDKKVKFDLAFLIVHGTPVEDGKLQGYFESKGIPHSTCNTLTCALTFNKQWCKDFLRTHGIPMAKSRVFLAKDIDKIALDALDFSYPVFVKPNQNGSSYGVSRVEDVGDLPAALRKAAEYDTEIMVESFLQGREFSCGVVKEVTPGEEDILHVFPLTEIIPEGTFFDYDAKYLGAGQEITPADLSEALTRKCQDRSGQLYQLLRCAGMVRFDYILVGDEFYLLEANTVPGLSEASIIPQQARAYGWSITHLFDVVIAGALSSI